MKKFKTIATGLMLSLFSTVAVAEQTGSTPQSDPVTPNVVAQTQATAPAIIQQAASNSNAVNINTATAAEIQDKLVGVGAKKAQAIIDYRTKHGNFTNIEQLKEVSGIGEATLEKNHDRIILQ